MYKTCPCFAVTRITNATPQGRNEARGRKGCRTGKSVRSPTAGRTTLPADAFSLPVHRSALHYEAHSRQHADVFCRIPPHCDHVCEVAGLERSNLSFPSEQFRSVDEVRLQNRKWIHPVLDHQLELSRLRAVRKR